MTRLPGWRSAMSRSSPTSTTARRRWSTRSCASATSFAQDQEVRERVHGLRRPRARARDHHHGQELRDHLRGRAHQPDRHARATPTSAAKSSACSRWPTACCCWWTPSRARCRRRASCCRRRCELNLKPVVVINKVDRPTGAAARGARRGLQPLRASWRPTTNSSTSAVSTPPGRDGWAVGELEDERRDLTPLLDMIVKHVPAASTWPGPLQMLIAAMDHSDYVGRIGIGRIVRGELKAREPRRADQARRQRATDASSSSSTSSTTSAAARSRRSVCGDICAVVGLEDVDIGDTLADPRLPGAAAHHRGRRADADDESSCANDSPCFGQDGTYVTSRQLRERLQREPERDVALRVEDTASADTFKVSGRGILHLSILMENMRREGYEFMVGQPQVIYKEIGGRKSEPVEVLTVDVPSDLAGTVIEYARHAPGRAGADGPERGPHPPGVPHPEPRADRLPQPDAARHRAARSSCTTASSSTSTSRARIPQRHDRQHHLAWATGHGAWPSRSTRCRTAAGSSSSRATCSTPGRSSARRSKEEDIDGQRAEGEAAVQHAGLRHRPQDEDRPGDQDGPRGVPRVHQRRRVRRGHARTHPLRKALLDENDRKQARKKISLSDGD